MTEIKYKNTNFNNAKKNKNNEFYTYYADVKNELDYYIDQFKDKIILLPCDNAQSAFFKYFINNYEAIKFKKVIASSFNINGNGLKIIFNGHTTINTVLNGNGDFMSDEIIELFKEADIVITNPPFSLYRQFISQLVNLNKKFLFIGHKNSISHLPTFEMYKNNEMRFGHTLILNFWRYDNNKIININMRNLTRWYTNLNINTVKPYFITTIKYYGNENKYNKYINFDCIDIPKQKLIPCDYKGYMGVPLTFLDKLNRNQFEIIGKTNSDNLYNLGKVRLDEKFKIDYFNYKGNKINTTILGYYDKNNNNLPVLPFTRIIIRYK